MFVINVLLSLFNLDYPKQLNPISIQLNQNVAETDLMSLFGSNKLTEAGPVPVYGIGFLKKLLQANSTTIGEEDMTDFKPENSTEYDGERKFTYVFND